MIRNFFKPVDSRRRSINLLVDDLNFDAQLARNREEIESRQTAKRMRLAESRASNNRVRMEAQREGVERTEYELVRDKIDDIVNHVDISESRQQKTVKTWSKRPPNWMDIVAESNAFGSRSAIRNFPNPSIRILRYCTVLVTSVRAQGSADKLIRSDFFWEGGGGISAKLL